MEISRREHKPESGSNLFGFCLGVSLNLQTHACVGHLFNSQHLFTLLVLFRRGKLTLSPPSNSLTRHCMYMATCTVSNTVSILVNGGNVECIALGVRVIPLCIYARFVFVFYLLVCYDIRNHGELWYVDSLGMLIGLSQKNSP